MLLDQRISNKIKDGRQCLVLVWDEQVIVGTGGIAEVQRNVRQVGGREKKRKYVLADGESKVNYCGTCDVVVDEVVEG